MTARKTALLPAPMLVLALAGCVGANSDRYPSLAVRDVERVQGSFEPVAQETIEVPVVEVDRGGDLESRLAALVAQARTAHAGFARLTPAARRSVAAARGAGVGSDSWAEAQVDLAQLDSARSEVAVALADLDTLHTADAVQGADTTAISAARDEVLAIVGEEDATLETLRAAVR